MLAYVTHDKFLDTPLSLDKVVYCSEPCILIRTVRFELDEHVASSGFVTCHLRHVSSTQGEDVCCRLDEFNIKYFKLKLILIL